jgi:hypothetical protein
MCFHPQVRGETPTLLGPSVTGGKHPVSETLCSMVFRIPADGQNPKNVVILRVLQHRQNTQKDIPP